ncbi:hypothetical protein KP509_30G031500 [Ceratopteris richardii]|uniref:Core Histone H2A/H2B/H3 domain-containing protein n=1 Tax=Ceratopteris richardii TaxID=49495 RepID=A0A8T2R2Z5_CERRI|nr:hypothetical protein KP509_30G031500 [Ceratopteris richardii]
MARTKKIARKLYPQDQEQNGHNQDDKGPSPQTTNQGLNASEKSSKKRVCYHVKSLREIRKAQKFTTSFINVNWQTQDLLCLQKAAKDFAINFMNDVYLCAAHCHRVTLMAKDYVIVSRLRYKSHKASKP